MKKFDIRFEYPNRTFMDFSIAAHDSFDAKVRVESKYHRVGTLNRFEWYGMVCFVDGAMKAEDMKL